MTIFTALTGASILPSPSDTPTTSARIVEISDAAASTATTYSMSYGDTFAGNLSSPGDRDWVEIQLQAGEILTFGLSGANGGGGTLSDPYLRLYDANGRLIALNDDSGIGLDSALTGSVDVTGTYYLAAGSYADSYSGSYELTVTIPAQPEPGTLDDLAGYLTDGFWADNGSARHSFDTSGSNVISVNLTGLTAAGQQLARWAFDAWEIVADIQFQETTNVTADIQFQDHNSGAYSSSHNIVAGATGYSIVNVSTNWIGSYGTTIDSYSLQTYIHEIGHALGLGHQGYYNGSASYGLDNLYTNDSWQLSVMSYFSQSENTATTASLGLLLSPMMADIIAIQDLYGAASESSETAGNTTWGANSNLDGPLGEFFGSFATPSSTYNGEDVVFTIFDQGGTDILDASPFTTSNRFDMRDGYFSDVAGLIGNIGIARGTVLENLIAGIGDDTVTGNAADNNINLGDGNNQADGGLGNDTLTGGVDSDALDGGEEADELYGQGGDDSLFGGLGDDTLSGSSGADMLFGNSGLDMIFGGTGDDTVSGGDGADKIYGQEGMDRIFGGGGNDTVSGGDGADKIYGQAGTDRIFGGGGNDTVSGDDGADKIYGQAGTDRIFGDGGNDTVSGGDGGDKIYGQAGTDRIFGDGGNDTISGGDNADGIYGGDGEDRLFGDAGDDTVSGQSGSDYLYGGDGKDRLFGNDGQDRLFGGAGNDLLHGGALNDRLFGEAGADRLIGDTGDDFLLGGSGTDRLEGGDGLDYLSGGTEADIFVFTDGIWADQVTDFSTLEADLINFFGVTALTSFADVTAAASQIAEGLLIQTGNGGSVLLEGLLLTDVDAGDFIF